MVRGGAARGSEVWAKGFALDCRDSGVVDSMRSDFSVSSRQRNCITEDVRASLYYSLARRWACGRCSPKGRQRRRLYRAAALVFSVCKQSVETPFPAHVFQDAPPPPDSPTSPATSLTKRVFTPRDSIPQSERPFREPHIGHDARRRSNSQTSTQCAASNKAPMTHSLPASALYHWTAPHGAPSAPLLSP